MRILANHCCCIFWHFSTTAVEAITYCSTWIKWGKLNSVVYWLFDAVCYVLPAQIVYFSYIIIIHTKLVGNKADGGNNLCRLLVYKGGNDNGINKQGCSNGSGECWYQHWTLFLFGATYNSWFGRIAADVNYLVGFSSIWSAEKICEWYMFKGN